MESLCLYDMFIKKQNVSLFFSVTYLENGKLILKVNNYRNLQVFVYFKLFVVSADIQLMLMLNVVR